MVPNIWRTLGLCTVMGCGQAPPAEPDRPAPPAVVAEEPLPAAEATNEPVAEEEAWRTVAQTCKDEGLVGRAKASVDRLEGQMRADVVAALDAIAAKKADVAGFTEAAQLAHDSHAAGMDPAWDGSGMAPWTRGIHDGAMAILGGMLTQMVEGETDAGALHTLVSDSPMPKLFGSGGRMSDAEDREALRALLPPRPAPKPTGPACTSVNECWVSDEGKAIARPKSKRGKKLKPCKDAERTPACKDGFCTVVYWRC